MAPYRSPGTGPPAALLHFSRRAVPKAIFGALVVGLLGLVGVSALVHNAVLTWLALVVFGVPAAGMLLLREKTWVYEDRVEQGRLLRSRVVIAEVRTVLRRSVAFDPFLAITTATEAMLDVVTLTSAHGVTVKLPESEIPAPVLEGVVGRSVEVAVAAAADAIAAGGTYRPSALYGIGRDTLHGFSPGLTMHKISLPLVDVEDISDRGVVQPRGGSPFFVGAHDLVFRALLGRLGVRHRLG